MGEASSRSKKTGANIRTAISAGMDSEYRSRLSGQGYHAVGAHSAVKRCKWFREALTTGRFCYKHSFYGIASHRCMQCTPALQFCSHACTFCWRTQEKETEMPPAGFRWDEPKAIAEGMLCEQLRLASGYGGNSKTEKKLWEEAKEPKHVALSLAGEPSLYPHLSDLLAEFHRRGMTTFLVSNGTAPEALESLQTLPTQLYLSMVSPNKEDYPGICRPWIKGGWEKWERSLEFLREAGKNRRTRTVLRMTLAKGLNLERPEGYARQISLAEPDYIEVKSFMFVGGSREEGRGLSLESMVRHSEIKEFAEKLAGLSGYLLSEEHLPSRIVLLCRDNETMKNRLLSKESNQSPTRQSP